MLLVLRTLLEGFVTYRALPFGPPFLRSAEAMRLATAVYSQPDCLLTHARQGRPRSHLVFLSTHSRHESVGLFRFCLGLTLCPRASGLALVAGGEVRVAACEESLAEGFVSDPVVSALASCGASCCMAHAVANPVEHMCCWELRGNCEAQQLRSSFVLFVSPSRRFTAEVQ